MNKIVPLSYETHGNSSWVKPTSFFYTAQDTYCPVAFSELPAALISLPLAFIKRDDTFVLAVLQGLGANKNLVVGEDGRWIVKFRPTAYSYYPFLVVEHESNMMICERSETEFITEAETGHRLFEDGGEYSVALKTLIEQITTHQAGLRLCEKIVNQISDLKLLTKWNIELQGEDGPVSIDGVYRIDEDKLNQLPASELANMRDSGGLMASYAQLLSMTNLEFLKYLLANSNTNTAVLGDSLTFDSGGSLNFDNL